MNTGESSSQECLSHCNKHWIKCPWFITVEGPVWIVSWFEITKYLFKEEDTTESVVCTFFSKPSPPAPLHLTAVVLRCVQHGVYRGAGRLWEHLRPAAGAVWKFLRPLQKRHAAQPGRPVPLLCIIQQLRTAGPKKVQQSRIEILNIFPSTLKIFHFGRNCAGQLLGREDFSYWKKKKTAPDVVQPNVREDLKTVEGREPDQQQLPGGEGMSFRT